MVLVTLIVYPSILADVFGLELLSSWRCATLGSGHEMDPIRVYAVVGVSSNMSLYCFSAWVLLAGLVIAAFKLLLGLQGVSLGLLDIDSIFACIRIVGVTGPT